MFKRIIKAYRRHQLLRAVKGLSPTVEILCYNASDNSYIVRYQIGKTTLKCKVYYDAVVHHAVRFDYEFYEHPDF